MNVQIKKVKEPKLDNSGKPMPLSAATINQRTQKVLKNMEEKELSSIIVYADKEHGSNFEYLVGFIPRFEEALLILNADGTSTLLLGNENYNKAQYSRLETKSIQVSLFSLPNQPMNSTKNLKEILAGVEIDTSKKIGLVGWKLIPEMIKEFDIPQFIIEAAYTIIDQKKLVNATGIFINPETGARITNNANEIAHYEYGSSLASDSMLEAMNNLEVGKKEIEIGEILNKHGQYNSVVTISAFGDRFIEGNLYPTQKTLDSGNKVSLTVGYRGGLSSRSGYAVMDEKELESVDENYLSDVVFPYFESYCYWLKNTTIGKSGGDFYKEFEETYPKVKYGWDLCPGHLTAEEEWLSSPIFEQSTARFQSGMIFQIDFIPHQKGHNSMSAESTVVLADKELRMAIENKYPEVWSRIENRRDYMLNELNIAIPEEILPLASTVGYYRPFLLNNEYCLTMKN
ncbi:aminopeptidase P family N-terminal domain-containing protein [Marinilactibacillus psychrotolerans]|uniref:Xaa-Pro aminopeptidase n=1 Tax=Marinilactibacillus psychrotolerans TaxID=191770 RepID=A0A5R9C8E1_9LACT|nr:aminopeptidase P family N-terminal domain-containing protein [Marinilactibacillus psychrotolerans]TLQ09586.1 Xaa-Pro aminopeptidase [Marinilactibacillus psychrotolerans]